MPPRAVKKGPVLGKKATARSTNSTAKHPDVSVKADELEAKKEGKAEDILKSKLEEKPAEGKSSGNGSGTGDAGKDILDDEDKNERLQLDDNEPEFEADEEIAVDYDEKMIDGDGQEGDEFDEEFEEGDEVEEEEGDVVDEEIDTGGEDIEDEEGHENIEEHEVVGEEEEHHEVFKERRKRKEFEVFVGGLDKDATEDDLRKVFSEVGEITEIRLLMNSQTKRNKGFAFLRFATVEQAKRAVSDLKNPVVHGKQCGVTPSEDSDTLFLGNICKTWTKEHLKDTLKNYGIDNIEDLILMEDLSKEGMNRGFAFLEFSSRSDAMDAYRRLRKRDVVLGIDRPAKVAFADSFTEPDEEIMSQVKTVFIDGIPPAWDEERVKEHVKKFGKIEKVELARNMPAARRKDFGFVTFDTHEAAATCAESIKNAELGEGDIKAKVRARLSRPLQRGRGKHNARGDFRTGHLASRDIHPSWNHFPSRRFPPLRESREIIGRGIPVGGRGPKKPIGFRGKRPLEISARTRHLPLPARSFGRRSPRGSPVYPKSSLKRHYDRQDGPDPRSRAVLEHGSGITTEGRSSYGHAYSRGRGYSDIPPRSLSQTTGRRAYVDEGYGRNVETPLPPYRGRVRNYDSISGSKRPYSAMVTKLISIFFLYLAFAGPSLRGDVLCTGLPFFSTLCECHLTLILILYKDGGAPTRFSDISTRHSRSRLEYDVTDGVHHEDSYGERLGRSHIGYSRTRSSLSEQDTHGPFGGRHGLSYSGGSLSEGDTGRMHSSSGYSSSYLSRGSDVGGGSYSSMYSTRNLGSRGYLYGSGSDSYY
ncbi:hypothetical protein KSP39_PZI014957 [Platanthera zijinensis]|uniref:RRM domain-containing protein n=1 Tax=Platanthera zijinensis TaxID=2320716 RepID=A0AAP0BB98_9ASPA